LDIYKCLKQQKPIEKPENKKVVTEKILMCS